MNRFTLLVVSVFVSFASADPIEWCPFCNGERIRDWSAAAHSDFFTDIHNPFTSIPVKSSKHFTAYITKGAFVPNYFLIVSTEHFERIADLPPDYMEDLAELKSFFATYYTDVLQTKFISFEHGPLPQCRAGGGGGGCIDHLHLHMLPYDQGKLSEHLKLMDELADPLELSSISDLNQPALEGVSYIFIEDISGQMYAFPVTGQIQSQLMRMIVASMGNYGEWNWRDFLDRGDFLANSMLTLTALAFYREYGPSKAAELVQCHRLLTKY